MLGYIKRQDNNFSIPDISEKYISEIKNRWDLMGFTEGLKEPKLKNISLAFEVASKFLIKKGETTTKYNHIESFVFPIIRRIFSLIDFELEIETIKRKTIQLIEHLSMEVIPKQTEEFTKLNIDVEAEWCAAYSDNYKLNL
jgi:hypothetical protein